MIVRCRAASVALVLLIALSAVRPASAQSIEVGVTFAFTGGYSAGSAAANETRNPSTGSTPLTLFQTDSRVLSAPGVNVHAGMAVTRRLFVFGDFQYSRPTLRTHLSADFEGAPDTSADTTVSSYLFGGGVEYRFAAGRWVPFASGGAGQVREVPEGGDVLTAVDVHAGGGVRRALTYGRHPLGFQSEVLATFRSRGVGFDSSHHVLPSVSAGITWRF
jgi:outer membrane protein with beta-barrel domain